MTKLTRAGRHPGPHQQVAAEEPGHSWWQVVCLTGVDYFSTLGAAGVPEGRGREPAR